MAQFQKGNTFGQGRARGSKNKSSFKVKNAIQKLIDDNIDVVQYDLDQLEPKDRLKIMLDLMSFVVPKMKSIEANVTAVTDMSADKIARLERMNDLILDIESERNPNANTDE